MRKEETIQCHICGELFTFKHFLLHCRNHMETRALSPIEDNSKKNILFLKLIDLYNSI
jgi:hypothetical protein